MFVTAKPMKNIKSNISFKQKPVKEQSLFPVMTAAELLAPKWRQQTLKDLRQIINVPEEYYQDVYQQLIANFAQFVQVLPSIEGGQLGSLFDEGLKRALLAVQLYQSQSNENAPLYTYAIFSTALLIDVRKVFANKKIMISDEKGYFINEWSPFEGDISEFGKYYKVRRYHRPITHLSTYITLLLARQIMPAAGFLWLADDLRLLNMWMAALVGDEDSAGGVGHFLNLSKMRLREAALKQSYVMPVEITEPKESALAENFWLWLKQKIANGERGLDPANPSIHDIPTGIFIEVPKIFKEFSITTDASIDWKETADRFNKLGIAELVEPAAKNLAEQKFLYLDKEKITQMALASQANQQNFNFKENDEAKNLTAKFFTQTNSVRENITKERDQKYAGVLNLEREWFLKVSQKMSKRATMNQYLQSLVSKIQETKVFAALNKFSMRQITVNKSKPSLRK